MDFSVIRSSRARRTTTSGSSRRSFRRPPRLRRLRAEGPSARASAGTPAKTPKPAPAPEKSPLLRPQHSSSRADSSARRHSSAALSANRAKLPPIDRPRGVPCGLPRVSLVVPSPARRRADDLADEADLQFQLGAERYRDGDYRGALEHFLASNRLVPNRNVGFNIARSYEKLKQYPEAFRYYTQALEGENDPQASERVADGAREDQAPRRGAQDRDRSPRAPRSTSIGAISGRAEPARVCSVSHRAVTR